MKNLASLKPYFLLWGSQSLSALGSAMTGYALILWLYRQSGSALETAMLSICSYATYVLNAVNGLMNTVQQPASDVAATLLVPKECYQKTSGLRSFSSSLNMILHPVIASALFGFFGIEAVIAVDLATFALAFVTLLLFIRFPEIPTEGKPQEKLLAAAKSGLSWLRSNRLVFNLILFLSFINLVASAYNAALPAMLLSRENGGDTVLGLVNAVTGAASLAGGLIAALLPPPKNRGRVYSCRNTLQFFTIPLGYFLGGLLVDRVFEPLLAAASPESLLVFLFGWGKGSGAAALFFVLGLAGVVVCLVFYRILRRYRWAEPTIQGVDIHKI